MRKFSLIIFAILIYILYGCGCRSDKAELHNAIQLITFADSLRSEGVLFNDTTKIKHAIDVLEHSFPRQRDLLGKAYFLMGRNYDVLHMDTKEVHWFVKCIEMKNIDPTIKGLSLSHISDICMHQGYNVEATYYRHYAIQCYQEAKNNQKMAAALIIQLENYILTNEMNEAKETKEKISKIELSDLLKSIYYEKCGLYFLRTHQLDSTLFYINHIPNKGHNYDNDNENYKLLSLLLLKAVTYDKLNNIDSAIIYYDKIINYKPLTNATLIKEKAFNKRLNIASRNNDTTFIDFYIKNKYLQHYQLNLDLEEERIAAEIIHKYFLKKQKNKDIALIALISIIITLSMIVLAFFIITLRKNKKTEIKYQETHAENKKISETLNKKNQLIERSLLYITTPSSENKMISVWKDTEQLKIFINKNAFNLWNKLEIKYKLQESDIRLCILILFKQTNKKCAEKLFLSEKSIPTKKLRIAKKLHTSSSNLYEEIIKIAAE